jgi:hypothetical protein
VFEQTVIEKSTMSLFTTRVEEPFDTSINNNNDTPLLLCSALILLTGPFSFLSFYFSPLFLFCFLLCEVYFGIVSKRETFFMGV